MATVAATRHQPDIGPSYRRLRAAGTPAKVALTACMRKLLTVLDAVVRRGTPWTPAADRLLPEAA